MKKAFTMMEIIVVIVVIGILAAVVVPRSGSKKLSEAAVQLISHIRYTQHLAMVDDRYNSNSIDSNSNLAKWYKERWTIQFSSAPTYNDGGDAYTIFSDYLADSTGNPDLEEIAKNPQNSSRLMSGGATGGNKLDISDNDFIGMKELNLGKTYNITNIDLSASCSFSGSKRISFDHLGRPLKGALKNYTSAYPTASRLITSPCEITLTSSEGNVVIVIERETGYAHII